MNSIFQTIITIVVNVVVIQIIENIRIKIRQKMQQINQRSQQKSIKSFDSFDSFENDNDNYDNNQFQSKHLDFFDLFYDDKFVIIDAIMKFINENIVFRDVHLFMIKARNFVVTKNENIVRRNFFQCLKNDVLN